MKNSFQWVLTRVLPTFCLFPLTLAASDLIAPGTEWETPVYLIDSGVEGPVFLLVGGVHGDEPAGAVAAGASAADVARFHGF